MRQGSDRANNSPFGLGGSVWGRETQAVVAVANRLETGMVWVNDIHTQGVDIPFGGHKQSGLGTEHGAEGRQLFTNPKTVLIRKTVRQPRVAASEGGESVTDQVEINSYAWSRPLSGTRHFEV
ncbi:aldehyde dehydrogenase family protein [Paraburkholderia sp. 22B1P]|uniref:aldehyde dehydrogenase family protein n=1 Tax=Paraburkholderia sp. 22B1P TaxID=3080498 RepID=UPI0030CD4768